MRIILLQRLCEHYFRGDDDALVIYRSANVKSPNMTERKSSKPSGIVTAYLVLYNFAQLLGYWLCLYFSHFRIPTRLWAQESLGDNMCIFSFFFTDQHLIWSCAYTMAMYKYACCMIEIAENCENLYFRVSGFIEPGTILRDLRRSTNHELFIFQCLWKYLGSKIHCPISSLTSVIV